MSEATDTQASEAARRGEIVSGPWLTADECLAWAKRYQAVPWNSLALACVADEQPSPLRVLASLLRLVGPASLDVPARSEPREPDWTK